MADNRFIPPKSTLEVLETVPDSVLRRLKQYSGRLATEAVRAMEERLPFFADLEASQRASVQLVVQAAVVNFVEWMRDPQSNVSYTAQAFEVVPQDLRRRIALRQSVEMVRITMEFFEEVVPLLARSEEQLTALTAGILRYSRDLAFAAATAYADQAEARGAWDTRMEANVVDAVVRGDTGPELQSQAAALNWDATAPATVIVGLPQPDRIDLASDDVHDVVDRNGRAALSDVHGTWLVAIVSGPLAPTDRFLTELLGVFADGPVVIGPTAPTLGGRAHQRHRGDRRDERRRGLERGAPAGIGPRVAARTGAAGRCDRDRSAGNRGDAPAGRRRSGAHRNTRRLSGLRRRDRGLRPQIVRSSKYRPLPAQTHRRLHRPRSHNSARRVRAARCRDRGPAGSSVIPPQHVKCRVRAGPRTVRPGPRAVHRAV